MNFPRCERLVDPHAKVHRYGWGLPAGAVPTDRHEESHANVVRESRRGSRSVVQAGLVDLGHRPLCRDSCHAPDPFAEAFAEVKEVGAQRLRDEHDEQCSGPGSPHI